MPREKKHKENKASKKSKSSRKQRDLEIDWVRLALLIAVIGAFAKFLGGLSSGDSIATGPPPVPNEIKTLVDLKWKPVSEGHLLGRVPSPGIAVPMFPELKRYFENQMFVGDPAVGESVFAAHREKESETVKLVAFQFSTSKSAKAVVWERDLVLDAVVSTSPLLGSKGLVYYPSSCDTVTAFDESTGITKWSYSFRDLNTCLIASWHYDTIGGNVIGLTTNGDLFALDGEHGKLNAAVRRVQCSQTSQCITSNLAFSNGLIAFKARPTAALVKESSDWFGGVDNTFLEAVYLVKMAESDADLLENFMFRVVKTVLLEAPMPFLASSDSVSFSPDGNTIIVGSANKVISFDSKLVQTSSYLEYPPQYSGSPNYIQAIVATIDGNLVVGTKSCLSLVSVDEYGALSETWRTSFESYFQHIQAFEVAVVLSSPLVLDNGILLRIGTTRGINETPVQAGVVLIDREDATGRHFIAGTHVSYSRLAVDVHGNIISLGSHVSIPEGAQQESLSRFHSGGLNVLTTFEDAIVLREMACVVRDRAANAVNHLGSHWFQSPSQSALNSARANLIRIQANVKQLLSLPGSSGELRKLSFDSSTKEFFVGVIEALDPFCVIA